VCVCVEGGVPAHPGSPACVSLGGGPSVRREGLLLDAYYHIAGGGLHLCRIGVWPGGGRWFFLNFNHWLA
jgi:hypothetical protein